MRRDGPPSGGDRAVHHDAQRSREMEAPAQTVRAHLRVGNEPNVDRAVANAGGSFKSS